MADRLTMTIEHARLNHRRVECGPGIPGCGPECEGDGAGKPVALCLTCYVWPCSVSILLGEIDRLTKVITEVAEDMLPGDIGWTKLRAAVGLTDADY